MEDGDGVKDNIEVIEYFSGVGRIAKLADHVGYTAVGFDMDDGAATAKRSGLSKSIGFELKWWPRASHQTDSQISFQCSNRFVCNTLQLVCAREPGNWISRPTSS